MNVHDPHWRGCRRLFLRAHEVKIVIGAHDFEKTKPQRVLIDVDVFVRLADSSSTRDRLEDVVDYDFIRLCIAQRVAQGPIELQETLADDLLGALMAHPLVIAARVKTEKPDVYPDCQAVGVEVWRSREDADVA